MKKTTRLMLLTAAFVACGNVANAQTTLDFETVGNAYTWVSFNNGTGGADDATGLTSQIANPSTIGINTSAKCLKFVEAATALPWGGFFTENLGTVTITAANKIVKVMVLKDKLTPFGVKFEGGTIGAVEILKTNLTTGAWEELTYDFTAQIGKTFTKLVFLPDFLLPNRLSGGTTYVDNVSFTASTNLSQVAVNNNIKCYPSEVTTHLTVSANTEINQINVCNLLGQSVKSFTVNATSKNIDMSAISAGNYFVTVKLANGQISTQKIVKQ